MGTIIKCKTIPPTPSTNAPLIKSAKVNAFPTKENSNNDAIPQTSLHIIIATIKAINVDNFLL